jgi:hypothetical protein
MTASAKMAAIHSSEVKGAEGNVPSVSGWAVAIIVQTIAAGNSTGLAREPTAASAAGEDVDDMPGISGIEAAPFVEVAPGRAEQAWVHTLGAKSGKATATKLTTTAAATNHLRVFLLPITRFLPLGQRLPDQVILKLFPIL